MAMGTRERTATHRCTHRHAPALGLGAINRREIVRFARREVTVSRPTVTGDPRDAPLSAHLRRMRSLLRSIAPTRAALATLATLCAAPSATAQRREARDSLRPLRVETIRDTALASLVRAEAAFMRDVVARRVEGWVAAFEPDAATFPARSAIAVGTATIRKNMTPLFSDTSVHVVWHPTYAAVARSGDLGYTFGYYRWTSRDSTGKPDAPADGRFVTIWRRDAAGAWKVAFDNGAPGPVPEGFFGAPR